MTQPFLSYRSAGWIQALLIALSIGTSALAQAETPVFIWGFQRGCQRLPDSDRTVERELYDQKIPAVLLTGPNGQPLPACTGERCGQALRAACPNIKGRLVGGQSLEGKIVRTRLWMYDLESGQTAYQDDYCHTCVASGAISRQVRSLLEHPRFGSAPGPSPSYCSAHAGAVEPKTASGPVYLSVSGPGPHKPALHAALKAQLEALGRQALPVPVESKNYSREELEQIVSGQQGAKVLIALVQKDGTVALTLYDQRARMSDAEEVNCPACGSEVLSSKVKETVSDLLNRCAGSQCAELVAAGEIQAPVAACDAFPSDICPSKSLDAMLTAADPLSGGGGLNPKTARLIKGLTWGGFAASAATAITLFAVSSTSAGSYKGASGNTIGNVLDVGGWTATGISAVLLGLSIPLTVVVDRAASGSAQPMSVSSRPAFIKCPN